MSSFPSDASDDVLKKTILLQKELIQTNYQIMETLARMEEKKDNLTKVLRIFESEGEKLQEKDDESEKSPEQIKLEVVEILSTAINMQKIGDECYADGKMELETLRQLGEKKKGLEAIITILTGKPTPTAEDD